MHDPAVPPCLHLALDGVLATRVGEGRRKPTLRFWEWEESAVVIGSFQSVKNEVDPEGAAKHGFEVVRRISGGGAMMMEKGNVVTYSLYVPAELVQGMSFADSYAFLDDWVLQGLRAIGIEATYQPLNDIASPLGKIGGAAQKRLGSGGVLHHVTMAYDLDNEKMLEVLRIGREKISDKGIASAAKRVDPMRSQTGLSRSAIIEILKQTFAGLYGATPGSISDDERAEVNVLAEQRIEHGSLDRREQHARDPADGNQLERGEPEIEENQQPADGVGRGAAERNLRIRDLAAVDREHSARLGIDRDDEQHDDTGGRERHQRAEGASRLQPEAHERNPRLPAFREAAAPLLKSRKLVLGRALDHRTQEGLTPDQLNASNDR